MKLFQNKCYNPSGANPSMYGPIEVSGWSLQFAYQPRLLKSILDHWHIPGILELRRTKMHSKLQTWVIWLPLPEQAVSQIAACSNFQPSFLLWLDGTSIYSPTSYPITNWRYSFRRGHCHVSDKKKWTWVTCSHFMKIKSLGETTELRMHIGYFPWGEILLCRHCILQRSPLDRAREKQTWPQQLQ